ncbi:LPXTG cell wall anchor domain-containing protein [Actinokineospora sp. HUAS TT18]|uniref:LPXTG cell wall anchor domain-containing protein n=1 Tax=Actinokineospora sp. HUAS TT18 TaxID=3447451 RepID=UPI003F526151
MRRSVASLTLAAFSIAGMLALSGTVGAAQNDTPPSGDDRATSHPVQAGNNVTEADCPTLFPGSTAVTVTYTVDQAGVYLDITAIPAGTTVAGVIVKGSSAYNKYTLESLGGVAALPWNDLHAPLAGQSEGPAQISHWFVCGTKDTSTTTSPTTTTTTDTTTTTTETTTTTTGTEPTSTTTASTTVTTTRPATTTTTVAPVPVDNDDLPDTGSNVGWMILLGAALLLTGGALMTVPRIRNAVLRRS